MWRGQCSVFFVSTFNFQLAYFKWCGWDSNPQTLVSKTSRSPLAYHTARVTDRNRTDMDLGHIQVPGPIQDGHHFFVKLQAVRIRTYNRVLNRDEPYQFGYTGTFVRAMRPVGFEPTLCGLKVRCATATPQPRNGPSAVDGWRLQSVAELRGMRIMFSSPFLAGVWGISKW
jgi:hypothetical protein